MEIKADLDAIQDSITDAQPAFAPFRAPLREDET